MIDWTRIRELKEEIGASDFAEVAALFLGEMDAEMRALPSAQGDAAQMRDRLHSMKGSALNIGFARLAALCAEGENRARAGDGHPVELAAVQSALDQSKALLETGGIGAMNAAGY
ncbi:Hpt domain protein [Roseivivax sp. THAF40]|uniref:Hpt domain-containing protein n=1 Tax=unclassified Roseivivax TaxID=2639302 RepID=UPI0012AA7426|nr:MULTISPECIES: Hpt domain-containing protein [unclassified Roseivivax]QFS84684.1 Hpt domain protein [Roseivivax sp. THAF197b]QFT48511.1 Hpt domain protein [Roseivivax sp. THAF40]